MSRSQRRLLPGGFLVLFASALLLLSQQAQAQPSLPPLNSPPSGMSLPGKFIWFDLATPDLENQKAFYRYVFDWTFRSPGNSDDGYTLALVGETPVAGLFRYDPSGGEQDGATWLSFMAVDDVEQAVDAAKANGGSLELGPASIAGRGRYALLRDPADAIFGVLDSASGDPADRDVPIGGVFWVDLFARDVRAMADFYGQLAPFEASLQPIIEDIERVLFTAHGRARAGIVPVDEEANRSAWVPYVRVADVDLTLEKALAGGGFAIVPPAPELLDGNLAIFVDPNGAVMGIVKWDDSSEPQP